MTKPAEATEELLYSRTFVNGWEQECVEKWYRIEHDVVRVITMWSDRPGREEDRAGHVEIFSPALKKWEQLMILPLTLQTDLCRGPVGPEIERARQKCEAELLLLAALVLGNDE